jgi:hypothetical protein
MSCPTSISVGDVKYIREDQLPPPSGNRAVIVVDRGWIFAGDVTEKDGRIYLDRAVWVFRWEVIGFDGVLANPKQAGVKLKRLSHRIDIPLDSEVFRVPVASDWGL